MTDRSLQLRVVQMRYEAASILSLELQRLDGGELPAFKAGAHIDLQLPGDNTRSYSLLNDACDRACYIIAVHCDPASRGGSRYVHEQMRVGDLVAAQGPRNNFPLDESAATSVLIAGGIGITPIIAMIRRLNALGRTWSLFYAARTRASAAFVPLLEQLRREGAGALTLAFDDESGGKYLDLAAIVTAAPADAHFYCCGPAPMLAAFERATKGIEPARVHLEYFSAQQEAATDGGFEIELRKSGRMIEVPPGRTMLAALLEAKVNVNYACSEGLCGSCLTRVIEGTPDHRDNYLTDEEKAGGEMIMICCSGAKSPKLVLDL